MKKLCLDTRSTDLHFLFVTAFLLSIVAAWALSVFYTWLFPLELNSPLALIASNRKQLKPEPAERFIFLVLSVFVPVVVFAVGLGLFRRVPSLPGLLSSRTVFWVSNFIILLSLPIFPLTGLQDSAGGPSRFAVYQYLIFPCLVGVLTLSGCWYANRSARLSQSATAQNSRWYGALPDVSDSSFRWILWGVFLVLVALQIACWRIFSEHSITLDGRWHDSSDAVFYSISQVFSGKTLMSDLPAQYGLYAAFLQPIYKMIGLSIFSVTAVFAVMQVCSLVALLAVIQTMVRDQAIKIMYALTLVCMTYGTFAWLLGIDDPYFQYWPLRFFWPAVSLWAFYRYTRCPSLPAAFCVSLMGAVGSLWNLDSGLVLVIAFAGVLAAKWAVLLTSSQTGTTAERRQLMKVLVLHIATFAVCILLMFVWLRLNAQVPLQTEWFYGYQKTFYSLGFMMLPMPVTPSPWMLVLGIYLMGLVVSLRLWALNPRSKTAGMLLYLALLGLGLFTYYQGRSHPLNLISVCWPAATMLAILADRVVRCVRTGLLSRWHMAYPVAALSLLLISPALLVVGVPRMLSDAVMAYQGRQQPEDALVRQEIAFIRKNAKPGEQCAILSLRQGLYHAATGTVSPLSGPGYVEMLLQRDLDSFVGQLTHSRLNCVFVGKGKSSALKLDIDILEILENYQIMDSAETDSMFLLKPKNR